MINLREDLAIFTAESDCKTCRIDQVS